MARTRHVPARYKEPSSSEEDSDSCKPPPQKMRKKSSTEQKPKLLTLEKKQTKCMECETEDSEKKMYICQTCHDLKFKDVNKVKKCAICSNCTIKKHIQQEHQIVDFFPYLSAHRYSTNSKLITPNLENLENSRKQLDEAVSMFNNLSVSISENHKELTDMARRSKTIGNQLMIFEKMESFMNKYKLKNIEQWYMNRKNECVDDSEILNLDENTNLPKTAIVWKTLKLRKNVEDW